MSAEQAAGGIVAASTNEFALVFGENAISTAQSLSQNRFRRAGFASSLYTREPWGATAPEEGIGRGGGREVFTLLRSDTSSVTFGDSFSSRGERAERCQWQKKRGERVAAGGR